jgi:hypothetical protein
MLSQAHTTERDPHPPRRRRHGACRAGGVGVRVARLTDLLNVIARSVDGLGFDGDASWAQDARTALAAYGSDAMYLNLTGEAGCQGAASAPLGVLWRAVIATISHSDDERTQRSLLGTRDCYLELGQPRAARTVSHVHVPAARRTAAGRPGSAR